MKLAAAVEAYFAELRRVRASGAATGERSSYPALAALLNAVGATLQPKVACVSELAEQGGGHPDFGLFAAHQVAKGRGRAGQVPERGIVEVKSLKEDAWLTAGSEQVSRYLGRYRLALVTNTRDFVLLGQDPAGRPQRLESYRLAGSAEEFDRLLETPRAFARHAGAGLGEFLARALAHRATLADPQDLAWLLASYARDGLARVEAAGGAPSLALVRTALEEALGVRFEGEKGQRLFHSTLVQTLFYGVFAAWVLWARGEAQAEGGPLFAGRASPARFSWREAVWHLRVPVLRALFQQISDPGRLQPLGLVEVLDWTAAALDRVDRPAFFARFQAGEAVPYFYEPFLEAFDADLRKQLGVWYTPREVIRYMVARVDQALRDDLGLAEGLAAENVYVLDPCCGTGAYLAEVLRRIAANLAERGAGALAGPLTKRAATERVCGFELMPAPFVVAHLQLGLTMQEVGAPFAAAGPERAQVFLTNALTGWEPRVTKPLPFPELAEERDRAERVKREAPILVILGNPPYNGFAGLAVEEERELSEAYRTVREVRAPEGQGLNDLYVRFFRMAERRIAEGTGQGIVSFITNYSWLDGLSFPGMRERFLEAFDAIRIDCLNGDKYRTGKVAPDGRPDPSVFSTPGNPVGIQVGTAVATLIRRAAHEPAESVGFRHLWGPGKREELLASREAEPDALYESVKPEPKLGLPFVPTAVGRDWFEWPALPDLFSASFPGVKTSRDAFLVDIDLDRLKARLRDYFDPRVSHEEMGRRYPSVMKATARYDAGAVRDALRARGGPREDGFVRFAYRPFDERWLYWEGDTGLLDRARSDYWPHVFERNLYLVTQQKPRRTWSPPQVISELGCIDLMDRSATCIPVYLRLESIGNEAKSTACRPNLSATAQRYLECLGLDVEDLFHHVLATLHDFSYRTANSDGLRMGWPRIPLPGWPNGVSDGAAATVAESAARGRELACLLDPGAPAPGVTSGAIRSDLVSIAVPTTLEGQGMRDSDFAVTAGWGHFGQGGVVMPGKGHSVERDYTPTERGDLGNQLSSLGDVTFDVYLNDRVYWRNIPAAIWGYKLGGYQVLKKWMSYREEGIMGRSMKLEEIQYFTEICRRIAAVVLLANEGEL